MDTSDRIDSNAKTSKSRFDGQVMWTGTAPRRDFQWRFLPVGLRTEKTILKQALGIEFKNSGGGGSTDQRHENGTALTCTGKKSNCSKPSRAPKSPFKTTGWLPPALTYWYPIRRHSQMRNIYKIVGLLALIGALIGLFMSINSPTAVPDTQPNSAPTETRSEPKAEVQTTPTVEDPFKKFLDQKDGNSNSGRKSDNVQVLPVQSGKDPFKDFLDKQKQTSKDQVVSPFGKN